MIRALEVNEAGEGNKKYLWVGEDLQRGKSSWRRRLSNKDLEEVGSETSGFQGKDSRAVVMALSREGSWSFQGTPRRQRKRLSALSEVLVRSNKDESCKAGSSREPPDSYGNRVLTLFCQAAAFHWD